MVSANYRQRANISDTSQKVEKCRAKMFDNKKRVIYIKGG